MSLFSSYYIHHPGLSVLKAVVSLYAHVYLAVVVVVVVRCWGVVGGDGGGGGSVLG